MILEIGLYIIVIQTVLSLGRGQTHHTCLSIALVQSQLLFNLSFLLDDIQIWIIKKSCYLVVGPFVVVLQFLKKSCHVHIVGLKLTPVEARAHLD